MKPPMLEIIILLVATVSSFYLKTFWLRIFVLILGIILILPGFYAMWSGAPYLPTLSKKFETIKKFAKFKTTDVVYELGCGDGKICRFIHKQNVKKVIGYEYSLPTFLLAKYLTWRFYKKNKIPKSKQNIEIRYGNFWKQNLQNTDVIFCFLLVKTMVKFEKIIWPQLKPGAKVLSNEFKMPNIEAKEKENGVLLYEKQTSRI